MAKAPKKPSAKKKTSANAKPKAAAALPAPAKESTILMPPEKTVTDLVRAGKNARKDMQSISGTFGEKVAAAVENKHLDRKALAMVRQLDAMSDEKLHITYFHLLVYLDYLGIPTRAKAQEEMFGEHQFGEDVGTGDAGEGVAAHDDDDNDDGNVVSLGTAARKVSEAAGA